MNGFLEARATSLRFSEPNETNPPNQGTAEMKTSNTTKTQPVAWSGTRLHRVLLPAPALMLAMSCSAGPEGDADRATNGPLYAVMYEVYDDTGSLSYLSLLDSLDLENVDLSQAREFGSGRSFIQAYNGWFFVGEAETPKVTRYRVSEGGELIVDAEPISFANFGFDYGQFDAWNVTFISPTKAYLMNFDDGTTIIWNPSSMEIVGEIPPPDEFAREGLSFESTPAALRDGLLFRTVSWVNYDEASYSTDFLLVTYDVETDEIVDMVTETRCPVPGNLVHQAEDGTVYFSNWIWPVAGAVMRDAPPPCVLRINPGENGFDPDWTLDYGDVAGGRQGAVFTYAGEGQALISVFHDERTSYDDQSDPWDYVGSNNWSIWSLNLQSKSGTRIEDLPFNGGAYTPVQFDGRLILMVPGGAEDNYATQLYEIVDGRAEPRVKLPGWSYQFVKLR